jgi:hypothetical protein
MKAGNRIIKVNAARCRNTEIATSPDNRTQFQNMQMSLNYTYLLDMEPVPEVDMVTDVRILNKTGINS